MLVDVVNPKQPQPMSPTRASGHWSDLGRPATPNGQKAKTRVIWPPYTWIPLSCRSDKACTPLPTPPAHHPQVEGGFVQGMGWLVLEELMWGDK